MKQSLVTGKEEIYFPENLRLKKLVQTLAVSATFIFVNFAVQGIVVYLRSWLTKAG